MPELNHKFTLGRMNKDADERLVQNGEYRDALNTQVATSDGSDIGTLQNLLGNTDISHDFINFDPQGDQLGDFEYHCIGSIVDGKTDRIYWMLSGVGKDIIAEYDYATQIVLPVVVDIYNANIVAGVGSGRVLNFDKNFLITGINIIDDFLFWTDNNVEPKQVNIQRAKMGCVNPTTFLADFNYQTDLYVKNRKIQDQVPPFVNTGRMREEHITVVKKAPKIAPRLEMKNTLRGDVDEDGFYGNIESIIIIDDPVNTLQDSDFNWLTTGVVFQTQSLVDYQQGDFLNLTLQSSGGLFTSDQVLSDIVIEITSSVQYRNGSNSSSSAYDSTSDLQDPNGLIIAGVSVPATSTWFVADIISGSLLINPDTTTFDVSLKQDQSLFKFKFPRFASRYKYTDGQYSTFSPFSEVAFLPSEFDYLPKEGYNLGMVNSVRKLAVKDFVDKNQIPDDVVEIDILYKESNSPMIYTVDTIKRVDLVASKYDSWNAVSSNMTSINNTTGFVDIPSEIVHAVVPSNQLVRSWDNVPRKALAQEVVGNRIVYGNYLQNYNMENSSTFSSKALSLALYKNSNITVDVRLKHTASSVGGVKSMVPELLNPLNANEYSPAKSIKSLRTYQLGVTYIDEFGRETPVFSSSTNGKNSIQVDKQVADQAGKLRAQIHNTPPEWAKDFKFFIKESSNEYYNLAMDRWYPAQDGNIWLSFPSAERNKVDEETFLILKKRHASDDFVPDNTKYKILAIENEAPLFIKTRRVPKKTVFDTDAVAAVIVAPLAPAIRLIGTAAYGFNDNTTGFPTPDGTQISFYDTGVTALAAIVEREGISGWEFRVRHAVGGTSKWYKIQSFEKDPIQPYITMVSKKRFGVDMNVTSSISWSSSPLAAAGAAFSNIQVEFVRNEVKNRPEFDGRFFVKVLADSTVKKAIIGRTVNGTTDWQVTGAIKSQYINPEASAFNFGSDAAFFGVPDIDTISIEEMSNSDKNNMQHAIHDSMSSGGQTYWDWAGKTTFAASTSSGWFIDKIEGFRPWKITGKMGWNYDDFNVTGNGYPSFPSNDDSYSTNKAGSFVQKGTFLSLAGVTNDKYNQQLKLVGTNTHSSSGNSYLNKPGLKAPGTMLRSGASHKYGGIIPSLGIDTSDSIIHLSYSGVGKDTALARFTSTASLKNYFDDTSWATSYVDEISFITTITQPGSLWRWKEDPDGIIYRTSGYDPSMSMTNVEWDKNTYDGVDGRLGTSLYNYTQFQDYIVEHYQMFVQYVPNWLGGSFQFGKRLTRAHFVSAGRHNESVSNVLITPIKLVASTPLGWLGHAKSDINNAASAGGWGGGLTSPPAPTYKYPSFTREWGKARGRRRRYMFAAKPFIDADGEVIDSSINASVLGAVNNNALNIITGLNIPTSNYLPTNDPDLLAHFAADGTVLDSTLRPTTNAPGIRPDGVYSGYGDVPAIKTLDALGAQSQNPGSCTFEIVVPYIETDDDDNFTTTNPAIWETEPKEDLDLDLYHEVGQIYPTELNKATMEQFVGPIRDYNVLLPKDNLNTKVSCYKTGTGWITLSTGASYTLATATAAGDPLLVGSIIPGSDDIRVISHEAPVSNSYCTDGVSLTEATCLAPNLWYDGSVGSDHHVWLEDVNGVKLIGDDISMGMYPTRVTPGVNDLLRFTREDGSTTESYITSIGQVVGATLDPISNLQVSEVLWNAYELDADSHNYEVTLPWYNCYSFGNGVESNRIRDDYNQVFIDKGAKVSTILEEPYLEDRRSSGLIYSGIYNSISNVNNLNQFIQAEKITKDLNPDGGSIQKLYTRDTNLVTICEDKVFKILANKDALFNADGNPQLVATDRVLGEATTFAGDYGISTNPESFAVDSFRMYFTDRVRGAVIRLSQDGITPISSIGMTDWFNDNLVGAKRLIGSFDDKKDEYNLNLSYLDYATYPVGILCERITVAGPPSLSGTPVTPTYLYQVVSPGVLVLNGSDASKFFIGDNVVGEGIVPGSVVTAVEYKGGGEWWIKLNQTPDIDDMWALLPQGKTTPYGYGARFIFPTRITASTEVQPSNTLSFSEKNKGWVSFKSFLKEGGLSLNNEYFTFKYGMLNQHHTNPVHNNFYGQQFDSSVEVLFNDIPGSVKSFGALNYEGSQSHITRDLQNSGEYWDNKNKLGWYVDKMHTNLQQGDLQEFKDKEGKWFSQVKGVTTKWLDDGMGGNIDTNEFSYQGIDDNSGIAIISGGYTSWDCVAAATGGYNCTEIPGLSGVYATEQLCLADPDTACGALCAGGGFVINVTNSDATNSACDDGYAYVNLPTMDPSVSFWNVSYKDDISGDMFDDPVTYYFFGDSNSYTLPEGDYTATVIDSNGCTSNQVFAIKCALVPMILCSPFNVTVNVDDATGNNSDGEITATMGSITPGATHWWVEYFANINGVLTSLYIDDNNGSNYLTGNISQLGFLATGDYLLRFYSNNGCDYDLPCVINSVPVIACPAGFFYNYTNNPGTDPNNVTCNNGMRSVTIDSIVASYNGVGMTLPTSFTVDFQEYPSNTSPTGIGPVISAANYNVSSLPVTLTEGNLVYGKYYKWTVTDNNNCTNKIGFFVSACNYIAPVVTPGCMDSQSINYNPLATIDDGSCIRPPRINKHRSQHSANCSPSGTYGAYECIGNDLETGWDRVKEVRVNTSATSFTIQYYKYSSTSWPGCPTDININTPIAQQFQLPASATPVGPLQGPFLVSNLNVIQTYGPNVIIESQQGNGPQFHLDLGGMDNLSNSACSGEKYAIEITDNNGLSSAVCIDIGNKPRVTQLNHHGHIPMNAVYNVPMGSGWNWHQYPDSNNPFWHAFAPKATITVTDATGPNCDDGQIEISNIIVGGCSSNYSVSLVFAPGENSTQLPCTSYTCWNHPDNVVNVGIPSSSSNSVVFGNLNPTNVMHPLYPGYGQGNYYIEILDNMGNRARYSSAVHWSPGVLLPNGNLIVSC